MAHSSIPVLPPVECLLAALAAARLGSFTAAAAELGVTHAAVSRRVAGAEAWAGLRLFERHGRGVRPSPEGQRLLTRLGQHFAEIDMLIDRESRPKARVSVRLAVTPSFARFWLLPRLVTLEGDTLRIEVLASGRNVDLVAGEADLAVRYGRGGWGEVEERPLFAEELLVPIGRGLDTASTPQAVLAGPLLHSGDAVLWRAFARQHQATFRPKAADRVLPDLASCLDAANHALGVALWPTALGSPPGSVVLAHQLEVSPPLRHYLLRPRKTRDEPARYLAEQLLAAREPITSFD